MSKHETPMTRWYWQQIGGTLVEEFVAVKGTSKFGILYFCYCENGGHIYVAYDKFWIFQHRSEKGR